MEYSDQEKIVLNYFFTNSDRKVFATKNFHPEVWALMQARYSRSKEGMRESFLKLLKEDTSNFEKLKDEIEKIKGGLESKNATEKAIQFMERWVLGYGHSSVAEGAVIGLSLEGISILATKVIEDNRLCSFIEKSTRYVSFDTSSFYIDEDLKNSEYYEDIKKYLNELFKVYLEMHDPVLNYVKSIVPLQQDMNEAAWERACGARRFDAIRYLLPTCTKTSLGWTVNARQLSHAISKLKSHPLKEMKELGEEIKQEASKVLPSLLRYADEKNYLIKTRREMTWLGDTFDIMNHNAEPVTLVYNPTDAEEMIISSILYKYKKEPFSNIREKIKHMSHEEREKIFDTFLKDMTEHDWPMRELEHIQFTFDIIIDYGAFRDLQRHRICTQTNQRFTTNLGYDVPKDIINAGMEIKYKEAMDRAKEIYEKVSEKYPLQAQYLLPLGFKKRYLLTMNLREISHLIKLRTIPLAHESYRKIAYRIYEIMKEKQPLLSKYLVCNYTEEELGRLKSEEKTERMSRVGPL
ncbi:MAG: FAD-dependent thymidylate synthase [Candidatus Nanoarchaeia archaeon]|nr:FAD-dependent thymidylate synthase [Candidatus Nanoarchaeia archaeon]